MLPSASCCSIKNKDSIRFLASFGLEPLCTKSLVNPSLASRSSTKLPKLVSKGILGSKVIPSIICFVEDSTELSNPPHNCCPCLETLKELERYFTVESKSLKSEVSTFNTPSKPGPKDSLNSLSTISNCCAGGNKVKDAAS